jgi:hypothetical protein
LAGAPLVQDSAGTTPFGFAFGKRGQLPVSEAFGGAADASATSSCRLGSDGILTVNTLLQNPLVSMATRNALVRNRHESDPPAWILLTSKR